MRKVKDLPTLDVSIHAPVKGATPLDSTGLVMLLVSIHAPVKGATYSMLSSPASTMFQFTLP